MMQGRLAFICTILAIATYLTVSANLLTLAGIPYVEPGGSILVKLHPAFYLAMLAALATVWQRAWVIEPRRDHLLDPLLSTFLGCLAVAGLFDLVSTDGSSLILLMDNFLPAGLIAIAIASTSAAERAWLATLTRGLLVVNAVLAVAEAAAQHHFIPLYLNDASYHETPDDFRPTALYDHPLTGAMATVIALGAGPRPGSRLVIRLATSALLATALMAFASRAALVIWVGSQLIQRISGGPTRHGQAPRWLGLSLITIVVISILLTTPIGERIVGHAYWDPSAAIRLKQWDILGRLDWQAIFFGLNREDFLRELHQLDLQDGVAVVECSPLLIMIDFGIIGGCLVLGGCLALFLWSWRRSDRIRRPVLICVLLIASSSNSLGRKCIILPVLLVATTCASTEGRERRVGKLSEGSSPGMALSTSSRHDGELSRDNLGENCATIRMRIVSRGAGMIVAAHHGRKRFYGCARQSG